jgi:hypothetical protein
VVSGISSIPTGELTVLDLSSEVLPATDADKNLASVLHGDFVRGDRAALWTLGHSAAVGH